MTYESSEAFALDCDISDPLADFRTRFCIPFRSNQEPLIYFAGNSLGLQPEGVGERIEQELSDWASMGVDGHFEAQTPWYSYHEVLRESAARLVGARPHEVVMMNTLTVNLHLMMVSFFRPTRERFKILMEYPAFPSDTYAIESQLCYHGYNPADALVQVRAATEDSPLETAEIVSAIERHGGQLALVLFGGVNYFTGQAYDIRAIAEAAHRVGTVAGFDLAHAAGNVPLSLHDWNVDFAVWCNYKYLNSGPGAVAGCFVHERHVRNAELPRFAGWWGNDPNKRFRMHLQPEFEPVPSADAWQVSNPPIFSLAPVRVSLDLFDEAGMPALRSKSERLTGFLMYLLDELPRGRFEIITPREPQRRGCQVSMLVHDRPRELLEALHAEGVVCDFREPNVIRVAPVPLYNTFHEVWRFAQVLRRHADVSH